MRNIVVTGGSRGLGLEISRKLVSTGYRVIAIARQVSEGLQRLMDEAEGLRAGSFAFRPFDLSEIDKIPTLVSELRKQHGSVFGLVNNAGISFEGALALMPAPQIEQLIRLNTISPIVLTRSVMRSMMAEGCGRIVNISSVTAFSGYSGLSVYSATKSAMVGFTKSLAREVGRIGITVNAIAPGFVETDLTREMSDEQRQTIARRSALKRLTDAEDVANAAEFLLSDKAKSITGTVLTVDAGSTA